MDITCFEVGKPVPFFKAKEGFSIVLTDTGFIICLSLNDLTKQEINSFSKQSLDIGVAYTNKVLFFLININNFISWSDIAFNINLSNCTPDDLYELSENEGYGITFLLIDDKTKILKAMRVIGLSNEFSCKLKECIKEQYDESFNNNKYVMNVINLQNTYSSKDLYNKFLVTKCSFHEK